MVLINEDILFWIYILWGIIKFFGLIFRVIFILFDFGLIFMIFFILIFWYLIDVFNLILDVFLNLIINL